jgi:hypothetical protein
LSFSTDANIAPADKTVTVTNNGETPLSFTVSDDASWLTVTPSSGTDGTVLTVSCAAQSIANNYSGTITITDPAASNSPQTINVSYEVTLFEVYRSTFGRGELPDGWTFVSSSGGEATLDNTDGAKIVIPAGVEADAISDPINSDDTAGLVTPVSGDFDIAFRVADMAAGDSSRMWNILLRGNSDARMIRFCLYANNITVKTYGYERFDGTGATIPISQPGWAWLNGHPPWMRATRSGDVYSFYTGGDGLDWLPMAQVTSSIDAETFKIGVGQYSQVLGLPMRVDEAVDLMAKGDTDARKAVPAYTKGTTETTTFAELPSWLTLDAQGDGSATLGANLVELATASSDPSRATITYNGAGYENAGILVSAQRSPLTPGKAFVVFGLAADDGGPQIDVYSNTPGYILEFDHNQFDTSIPVIVRRPITLDIFDEPYGFIGPGGMTVNQDNICWFRVEKYGSRLRMRQWDESRTTEPTWWLYDGEIDMLRGVGPIKPYVSIAHNPGLGENSAINIFSLEFYELT